MQYRKFGRLDFKVSALGFGCMRLPTTDRDPNSGKIDEKETVKMIRTAVDKGVNYLDTAYVYHAGRSETVTGKALKNGYRNKVMVATKSPTWMIHKPEDFDRFLDEQLKRLGTDHIDFYLLHSLNSHFWTNIILKFGILEKSEQAIRDGKIRHLGFSFHDEYDSFQKIIDGYDKWEFCQIQYNYLDTENQAGIKGLKYAANNGIPVIVMEPLLGGRLAKPPLHVQKIFDGHSPKMHPFEWALHWLWNQPEVATVLSGMSNMEQTEGNVRAAGESSIGKLVPEDMEMFDKIIRQYRDLKLIPCTRCGYCMPCPNGVGIPRNFEVYNDGYIHNDITGARFSYANFFRDKERASACIQCRVCEEHCPQKIIISEWMPKVHAVLGEKQPY